jgi:hypothetical protein
MLHSGGPKLLSKRWIILTERSIASALMDAKGVSLVYFNFNLPFNGFALDSPKIAPNEGTRSQCGYSEARFHCLTIHLLGCVVQLTWG